MEAWRNELYLQHHGVLGMHWGIRRYQPYPKGHAGGKEVGEAARHRPSRSERKSIKAAKKDAKKYVDAKMFYGKGAGTRRKLLKAELSGKMKDPVYKKAFDDTVTNADYQKSAAKARRERTARDVAYRAKVTSHKAAAAITGGAATTIAGLYYMTHKEMVDSFVKEKGSEILSEAIRRGTAYKMGKHWAKMGLG